VIGWQTDHGQVLDMQMPVVQPLPVTTPPAERFAHVHRAFLLSSRSDQQLVALQAPEVQPLQVITPPLHCMQHRCWVLAALFWQYGVVQACARADGSRNSKAALLSRPNDLRMVIEPLAHQQGRPAHSVLRARGEAAAVLGDHGS
jgi:hypothetical protein